MPTPLPPPRPPAPGREDPAGGKGGPLGKGGLFGKGGPFGMGGAPTGRGPLGDGPTGDAAERFRAHRGAIIAFGVVCALLGLAALALVETATIASVLTIGVFMVIAGVFEILVGFRTRSWGRMFLWEAAGLLYVVAGVFAIALPELASVVLTLLLGAGLLATGLVRVVVGLRVSGSRSRGGLILAGAVTALLGLLIVLGWPANSVLILGTLLGIDLLFYGITWVMFGLRVGASRP